MIPRLLNLPKDESFFLFGARSTGKTTILRNLPWLKEAVFINLLEAKTENRFARNPDELSAIVRALPGNQSHVIIDEIQKLPKLLDIVHDLIETTDKKFILTGSSARRLKRDGANLLAGRAFVYHLYPFSFLEIENQFHLNQALQYGLLPKIFEYKTTQKKELFLEAYANTFLKEEIWLEKFIRELDPFRYFLEVAAQSNGKTINFANIARDIGSNDNTVKSYYSILEDTLIGSFLQPFQHSFRKRLSKSPKFYFFDPGVVRVLTGQIEVPIVERTSAYGEAFEHFIITQCKQLASYFHRNFRFSYLATKDGSEIDCVVERPGLPILFIEIKSTESVEERQLSTLKTLATDFGECEAVCFSRDAYQKQYGIIKVFPWADGIKHYFSDKS
ncbi:MAG: AAA family ATPase [Legionella sp.]|nr:AAA family ATPase [Legionella sp.]